MRRPRKARGGWGILQRWFRTRPKSVLRSRKANGDSRQSDAGGAYAGIMESAAVGGEPDKSTMRTCDTQRQGQPTTGEGETTPATNPGETNAVEKEARPNNGESAVKEDGEAVALKIEEVDSGDSGDAKSIHVDQSQAKADTDPSDKSAYRQGRPHGHWSPMSPSRREGKVLLVGSLLVGKDLSLPITSGLDTEETERREQSDQAQPKDAIKSTSSLVPSIRETRTRVQAALKKAEIIAKKNDGDDNMVKEEEEEHVLDELAFQETYDDVVFSIDEAIFQEDDDEGLEDLFCHSAADENPVFAESEKDEEIVKMYARRHETTPIKEGMGPRLHAIDESSHNDEMREDDHDGDKDDAQVSSRVEESVFSKSPVAAKPSPSSVLLPKIVSTPTNDFMKRETARLRSDVKRLSDTFDSLFESARPSSSS